ncbi:D-glycerate dehydrogenase [Haloechinothrix sp. LS1_15]|nr:D-glycerate dehydrogenase [Haloechinothrix sp. LS1_15]
MQAAGELGRELVVGGEQPPDRSWLLEAARGASAVVCTLTEQIDAELLDAAGSDLRVVANVAVGYDNVDTAAAKERGVVVSNTPGVLDAATADLTMALLLGLSRRVTEGDRFLRAGTSWIWGPRMFVGTDVSAGCTLGVVGYGRIGKAVARRALAFDMDVLAHSPSLPTSGEDGSGVSYTDLPTLLRLADIVTLHVPLTEDTRHLIAAEGLRAMKRDALLINTARGGVVDTEALVAALRAGEIGGAALDVFEDEPNVDPRLLEFDNVVLTPHIASAGRATRDRMGTLAVDNVAAVLDGEEALTPVNAGG